MGRGMGKKAALTRKCSCDNPEWFKDDIEVNGNTKEITYKLTCRNCNANWGTKSLEARKYWIPHFDKIPVVWLGYGYKGNKTVKELFIEIDTERLSVLQHQSECANNKLLEAQQEVDKANKVLVKYQEQMKDWQ